jgi:hypothetical protein|tara:strand:- start:1450 stop:3624 length:2175 start_codon:yes stop_codon:yes gene_type:complete
MVLKNIFKQTSSNNVKHPITPSVNVNSIQGQQYNNIKINKQNNNFKKNKEIVEGFVETMTAKKKNKKDLLRFKELQKEMDVLLISLDTTSDNLLTETKKELELGTKSDNIYAIDPGIVSNSSYIGCYKDDHDNRTLPIYAGILTSEQCAQRAHDLGETLYGMQDSNTNKGKCFIGNDISKAKSLGISTNDIVTWQAKKNVINQISLGYDGKLMGTKRVASSFDKGVSNVWGGGVWNSTSSQSGCIYKKGAISDIQATYGGNCSGYDSNADFGTTVGNTTKFAAFANNKTYADITVDSGKWGDPAIGCGKDFNITYNCGFDTKIINISGEANGKTVSLNCPDKDAMCSKAPFFLLMQNDGNLVIYTKDKKPIWATNTAGKVGKIYKENWINDTKNKGNRLNSGEILNKGEFLCSENGKNIAILQDDGNFRVYMSNSACVTLSNGNNIGSTLTNALYQIQKNDVSSLGKVGNLIDSKLRNFPDKMLSDKGTTFYKISGFKIPENSDMGMEKNKTLDDYKSIAISNPNIIIFWHDTTNNIAYFYSEKCPSKGFCKGKEFPILQSRIADSNADLYIKNKSVNSNDTCGKESEGVTLFNYDSYTLGNDMKKNSPCGLAKAIKHELNIDNKTYEQTLIKAKEILNEMIKLTKTSKEIRDLRSNKRDELDTSIKYYKNIYDKIKKNLNTAITVKAQKEDSDLIRIADNFNYVMWSVVAIITVIITIKIVKK